METANEENHANYHVHVPTLAQRFWRKMGFTYHHGEEPPDADLLPGWMCTETGFDFGWADRFRLLLTGKLHIRNIVHIDTPSPAVTKTRMDWHIIAPGGE